MDGDRGRGVAASGGAARPRAFTDGLGGLLSALLVLGAGATVASFLGRLDWLLELFAHFRVQLALGGALVALGLFAVRAWRRAALAAALALVSGATVLPRYVPEGPAPAGGPTLRVVLHNVNNANPLHAAVAEQLRALDPDLAVILEVDEGWLATLREALPEHVHVAARPRPDNFGIALLSRRPLEAVEVLALGDVGVPSIGARVSLGGRPVTVLATHPVPPVSGSYAAWRDGQLVALAELAARRGAEGPLLLLGDLNCTPWSPRFTDLLRDGGLQDGARGHGLLATWPAFVPAPLRLPIDHALVGGGLGVRELALGRACGSDHRPLVVTLGLVD